MSQVRRSQKTEAKALRRKQRRAKVTDRQRKEVAQKKIDYLLKGMANTHQLRQKAEDAAEEAELFPPTKEQKREAYKARQKALNER